jgi:hypothetical protein
MIPDEARDPILIGLGRLSALQPDATRAVRVRALCRAALSRRQQRFTRTARGRTVVRRVLEPALVAGFCLIYLLGVAYDVLLRGVR